MQYLLDELEMGRVRSKFLVVSPSMEELIKSSFGQDITIVVQKSLKVLLMLRYCFPLMQEGIDWF